MADAQSRALFARAERVIPGGVNSPVRAFRSVGGEPVFFRSAKGAKLTAVDGTEYVDCVGSWGPAILGHAHDEVIAAVREVAASGLSFGAPTALEVEFAETIVGLYPSMDMVRAVSSGTEACMAALRAARGATKRELIVKFEGCYHGHADALLVKAGSGAATFGVPDSAGVAEGVARSTLTLPYNDVDALRALFAARGKEIAAVIVEPVVGNMGCVPPVPGFLEALVAVAEEHGAVAIFDEVMTGCRLAKGGAQERFGIRPHMTTLGKVVGGGMPLAAYGGQRWIMEQIAPLGPVYQAGTLSGNPVAVTAGLATLARLGPAEYEKLEALGARLEAGLSRALVDRGVEGCVQRVGSMITLFFTPGPVRSWSDADRADRGRFASFHAGLLSRGVYWPPSQFEAAFLSVAHDESHIDHIVRAAGEALSLRTMSHILVTGGAGYIGSTLVPLLLEQGHEVTVLDRLYFGRDTLPDHPKLTVVRDDVRRVDPRVFEGKTAVVDLAGISNDPACELDSELTLSVNLEGGKRTHRLAHAAGVERIVFASSCSVYGHGEGTALSEVSPLRPVSLYARCKAEAEASLLELGKTTGLCVTSLRFATVFGLSRRMRLDLAVNVMTKNAYVDQRVVVEGGGKQWRPFVHVRDVSEAIARTLSMPKPAVSGQVLNVGSNQGNSRILNLAYRVRDAVPGTHVDVARMDPDLRDYNVSFDKLAKLYDWSPSRSIDLGITEVLGALRSGELDPSERRWYTLKQYGFLVDVERAFRDMELSGHVLS